MNSLIGPRKLRPSAFLLLTAVAGMAAAPAISQIRPMGVPTEPQPVANQPRTTVPVRPGTTAPALRTAPDAPVPGNPDYQADQQQSAQLAPVAPALPPA